MNKNYNKLINSYIFHTYKNNKRKLLSKQKTRGEINYSNKKIRPQKGTGYARISTKASPIFKGGGRAFPNTPLIYKRKINKKIYINFLYKCIKYFLINKKIYKIKILKKLKTKTKKIKLWLIKHNLINKKILIINSKYKCKNLKNSINNIKNIIIISKIKINPKNIIYTDIILLL